MKIWRKEEGHSLGKSRKEMSPGTLTVTMSSGRGQGLRSAAPLLLPAPARGALASGSEALASEEDRFDMGTVVVSR